MGAFEDRLAAGYRKAGKRSNMLVADEAGVMKGVPTAERAPLRTAQTTTPTTETGKRLIRWGVTNDGEHITTLPSLSSILAIEQEAAAQERRRLLEAHMADHDDDTGWCSTCSLLTEGE